MNRFLPCFLFLIALHAIAQQGGVRGILLDSRTRYPLEGAAIYIEGETGRVGSDMKGTFLLRGTPSGKQLLVIKLPDYIEKRLAIEITDANIINLGTIQLEREVRTDQTDPVVSLTADEFEQNGAIASSYGLLTAGRDVFLRRSAFDFSQVFFRPRGYDSRNARILLNGFVMNSLYTGRPQWNHWGGLNDISRNQEISYGLKPVSFSNGDLLGATYIDTRPSGMRSGYRFTSSFSNRSYRHRLMATYVSQPFDSVFTFALSASRRWAEEGQVAGTMYEAWSAFASGEYFLSANNSLNLNIIMASDRRGRSAALTSEAADLLGAGYNPYWGYQNGLVRNSRVRKMSEPIVQLNFNHINRNVSYRIGVSYQSGAVGQSRLGYYGAPNPDPVYYRYMPSFAINSPTGANYINARIARLALLKDPQLNWESLYRSNTHVQQSGRAAYVLYGDVVENRQMSFQAFANIITGKRTNLLAGLEFRNLISGNYARIEDLLGAAYHEDSDPFSSTLNDLDGRMKKVAGDVFGYNYKTMARALNPFLGIRYSESSLTMSASVAYTGVRYQRLGKFRNGRFPDNSKGPGSGIGFDGYTLKGGFQYQFATRHWLGLYGMTGTRPPLLKHVFINPRESNAQVPDVRNERIDALELTYDLRLPLLSGRLSAFYSRMMDKTDIHFFFSDTGIGSDFVQEVLTHLDYLNMGVELGLEYNITTNLKASFVAAFGKYLYGNDPMVTINFDTAASGQDLINNEGYVQLGPSALKGYKQPSGPQKSLSIGMEYRDPDYWWLGITANYLADSFISPAALPRTASFRIDPETGIPFPGSSEEMLKQVLARESLESSYILNLTAGKSWLQGKVYINLFASVNNLFDTQFRTGGYEQGRNGNYGQWVQDNLSGYPSFGPKYWYGHGRTFFLNLSLSI